MIDGNFQLFRSCGFFMLKIISWLLVFLRVDKSCSDSYLGRDDFSGKVLNFVQCQIHFSWFQFDFFFTSSDHFFC